MDTHQRKQWQTTGKAQGSKTTALNHVYNQFSCLINLVIEISSVYYQLKQKMSYFDQMMKRQSLSNDDQHKKKSIKSIYKCWFVCRIDMIGFVVALLMSVGGSAIWWSKPDVIRCKKSTLKCELFKWISGDAFQVQTCWLETRLNLLKPNTVRLILHSHFWLLSCFPLLLNEKSSERVHALKIAQEKCNIAGLIQKQYISTD